MLLSDDIRQANTDSAGLDASRRSVAMSSGSVNSVGTYMEWGAPFGRERTTLSGFYYLSGSSHGGYVVNGVALTDQEQCDLRALGHEPMLFCVVSSRDRGITGVVANRARKVNWTETVVKNYPIWVFEEDCDWASLELVTGVRVLSCGKTYTNREWLDHLRGVVERWACTLETYGEPPQPIPDRMEALDRIYSKQLASFEGHLDELLFADLKTKTKK